MGKKGKPIKGDIARCVSVLFLAQMVQCPVNMTRNRFKAFCRANKYTPRDMTPRQVMLFLQELVDYRDTEEADIDEHISI